MLSASLNKTFLSLSLSTGINGIKKITDHLYEKPKGAKKIMIEMGQGWGDVGVDRGRKEMFYLTTHSTHFIYGYMASDIW